MRKFRPSDPEEMFPDDPGEEVFRVTAYSGGIIGLYINDESALSLFEIAGILHDMSVDVAKYISDRHEKAKEN